ncbi:MAG: stage II sporulation protein P [bacterium]
MLRNTLLLTLATCILIAGVSFSWPPSPAAVTVFAPRREGGEEQRNNLLASFLQWLPLDYREVLSHGLPLFRYEKDKGEKVPGPGAGSFWEKAVGLLTWIDISEPRSIILGQVPLLRQVSFSDQKREERIPSQRREVATVNPTPSSPPPPTNLPEGGPRVAIFHTHASETFIPLHNASHVYEDVSGIVRAGQVLAQELRKKGITVIHDQTPHDIDVHREAYSHSAKTVAAILQEHPDLELIIDLHRDAPSASAAESRSITSTTVAGEKMAGILFMVGTDGLGLEHPNWRENHMLAQQISRQMEQMYPGLSRGVRTSRARYNQHLSPRMILVELGGVENNMEEITRAAECLADVLAAIISKD